MITLDWIDLTQWFTLRIPRGEANPQKLVREEGWDFSTSASSAGTAVLMTREPYAAAAWGSVALPAAYMKLGPLLAEIEASWRKDSDFKAIVPADKTLWPFQRAGVEYATRRRNTLIADQPGLGKTAQAIAYCNTTNAQRVLVVCPASIRLQWCKAIREWSTMPWPYHVYPILSGGRGVHPTSAWTVVSYDLARSSSIGRGLAAGLYDVLILDEAHYLKTVDAGRTRAVFGGGKNRPFEALATRCGAILGLTGTPLPNRPREAYTLARGLCFDAIDWMSEDAFCSRFNPSMKIEGFDQQGDPYVYVREEAGRAAELQNRLRANFMVRRLKPQVLTQLPEVMHDIVQSEETGPVTMALKAESLLHIDPEHLETADVKVLGHIAAVRHQMGVALAPQVAEYAEMILDGGEEKLIIFGHHIAVLDILQVRLQRYGVLRIDGSTSNQQRQARVLAFQKERDKRVFVGQHQSIGTGTDGLQDVCWRALFAEASWVHGENQQCIDRLHRIGQRNAVFAEFMVAPGSLTEKVLASALRKGRAVHRALDEVRC